MTARRIGHTVMLSGHSAGSYFPRTLGTLHDNLDCAGVGDEGPYRVDGSIWAENMRFRGPGVVNGCVIGRGDIGLDNHTDEVQSFRSGLYAVGNIVAHARGQALVESLTADISHADYTIRGDVVGQNIYLENAIVLGNIEATQVRLVHCIVLGEVIAREKLWVFSSTLLCYHASRVAIAGPCCFVHASGDSAAKPVVGSYRDGSGELWKPDIRYYPVFRDAQPSALSNRSWLEQSAAYEEARLDPATDWARSSDASGAERWVLHVGARLLNPKTIAPNLDAIDLLMRSGLEFEHYHPDKRPDVYASWIDKLTPDELELVQLVTGYRGVTG